MYANQYEGTHWTQRFHPAFVYACHSHRTVWSIVLQRFATVSPTIVAMDWFSAPIPEAEEEAEVS